MTVRKRVILWQADHADFRADLENAFAPFYPQDVFEPCPSMYIVGHAVNDLYNLCESLDRWLEVKRNGANLTEWETGRLHEAERDIQMFFEKLNVVGEQRKG